MADPTLSAQTAETDLRGLARLVLEPVLGPNWVERSGVFTPEQTEKIKARRSEEQGKRGGAVVEQSLVFYIDLWDLITMTKRHWTRFKKVLGPNRERWNQESQLLYNMRNAQAHGRVLLGFERDLLSGIAGDIRNRVTRYRSDVDPQENWWPRIESATDSFGNASSGRGGGFVAAGILDTGLVLSVGDVVTYECAGWDPQDRVLTWTIRHHSTTCATAQGTNVTLPVTITDQMIGANVYLNIELQVDAPYHRQPRTDDNISFRYVVRPPGV